MMRFLITTLLLLVTIVTQAATYYVSPTGNDSNTGTSTSSPWRTITKVNSRTYVAGDQILFERGGTYRGNVTINQSGTATSPIVISAYGSGARPILLGSTQATNWVVHSGNVWKTQLTSTQAISVFYNDSMLTLARYPNTGWLTNDQGSTSQINDAQLTQPSGYWNNASVVVRSTAWSYDTATVLNYTTGTLNLRPIYYDLGSYTWGYFLQNKLEQLDAPGEWYFDKATSMLYLYPLSGDPNLNVVDVVTSNGNNVAVGVRVPWQRNYITIENLDFRRYGYAGVSTSGSMGIVVNNCSFDQCDTGIWSYGNNQTFTNNTLTRCFKQAINGISGGNPSYGNGNLFQNNIVRHCAIYPGLGKTSWGYFGIIVTGQNNVIRGNMLTNIGYIGLSFEGNAVVEDNLIQNACSILNDGSGIAFDRTDGAIIRNNLVLSTLGNVESCASNFTGCDPKGKGIYFGNISNKNNLVEGNTAAFCNGAGIWFDHTMVQTGNQIRNNTLFGNNLYQFGASDYSNYNGPGATSPYAVAAYPNQSVTGNIFYSNSQSQKTMYHINKWFSGVDFADFNNNKYVNPWDTVSIQVWDIAGNGTNQNYSLSQWRTVRGDDLLSTNSPYLPQSTSSDHILACNTTTSTQSIALLSGTWKDLNGTTYQSSIQLDGLKSKPLYRLTAPPTPPPPPGSSPSSNKPVLVNAVAQPNAIVLNWVSYSTGTGFAIHRKLKTATSWGTALANVSSAVTTYTDNTAVPNTYYEYRVTRSGGNIGYGYCASAINLAPIDYRGKIILVVDNTMLTPLANEINVLKNDMKADGWQVLQINASRTDVPVNIKNQILTLYNADPTNVKAVYMLGHIPVYRGGNIAPDGHELRPFATDLYYGDMGSSTWLNPNPTTIPSSIELEVGRVDMFNMPAFPLSETELLRRYLNKAHAFKIKQVVPQNRALIKDNLSWLSQPLCEMSYRNLGPLVGNDNITTLRCATCVTGSTATFVSEASNASGYLWTYGSGGGTYTSADGIGTTTDFVNSPHNGVFNMVCGSYFVNWDKIDAEANCFLKAPLASNGMALTNIWAGQPNVWFHHMGMGDHIGYSTRITANNTGSSALYQFQNTGWEANGYTTIAIGLMGDPSLRMNYITPPSNFTVASAGGGNLTFSWNLSPESGLAGYHIYDLTSGVPVRLTSNPVTASPITLSSTGTEFMVKAVKLHTSPSGTYFNTSLGIGATITQPANCTLAAKVWLQGPYNGVDMNDNLRSANLIPLSDPYPGFGYTHVNGGGATTTSAALAVTGSNAIVDWIVVEVRNATTPTQRVYTTSALLQRDGDIVATNGTSPVTIPLSPGQYYIAIRHRNHLGVMTASPINLTTGSTLNMSTAAMWGTEPMTNISGVNLLWAGDASFDGAIKYSGSGNDRDLILSRIGGTIPTTIVSGYFREDINMNGSTAYTGADNDRDIILLNIGGSVPTNTKNQQIP